MRVLFALPGLHRYNRGAEIAFISIARELSKSVESVTLIGSGLEDPTAPYRFLHAKSIRRESFEAFPSVPILRNEYAYEDLTFAPDLLRRYRPAHYDITVTCNFPFTNWALRRPTFRGHAPPHIFVTQNGDWPAIAQNAEYRLFGCDGLVCTNPDFYANNKDRWRCALIPNGVDCSRFHPGEPRRDRFGLPGDKLVVLMVSALIPTKRVELGITAIGKLPDTHLVVAGDGPLRQEIDAKAANLIPGRFTRVSVAPAEMPDLYRSADVFLHLSKEESFGNVFLEAMACGLPVVAPSSKRLQWIVGEDEYLVENGHSEEIAAQLNLARASTHETIDSRVAKAAKFSWSSIAIKYHDFFHEVIDNAIARKRG